MASCVQGVIKFFSSFVFALVSLCI
jgi:hypothetical protein